MSSTLQLRVNERALISNLRLAFSSEEETWIKELLQNARRAGASAIHITVEPETSTITFEDDGCGIQNLQHILTVAESGWSKDLLDSEKPYGMGFLSSLFAAKEITIASQGKMVTFDTDAILKFQDVKVSLSQKSAYSTTIILSGVTHLPDQRRLENLVRGFPVPVFFNGQELERPCAVDQMQFVKTEVGLVSLDTHQDTTWYLQGFPIHTWHVGGGSDIVHLDSRKFVGRLPDRQQLENFSEVYPFVQQAIDDLHEDFLRRRCEVAIQEENWDFFHRNAWHILNNKRLRPILNQLDFLPNTLVVGKIVGPALFYERRQQQPVPILRSDVEGGKTLVFDERCYASVLTQTILAAIGAVEVVQLDPGHWLYPYVIRDIEDVEITAVDSGETKLDARKTASLELTSAAVDVVACQSIMIDASLHTLYGPKKIHRQITDHAIARLQGCEEDNFDARTTTLFVPANHPGNRLALLADYYDYDGNDELAAEHLLRDERKISRLVHLLRDGNVEAIFYGLLQDNIQACDHAQFLGKAFRVAYDQKGNLSVSLIVDK